MLQRLDCDKVEDVAHAKTCGASADKSVEEKRPSILGKDQLTLIVSTSEHHSHTRSKSRSTFLESCSYLIAFGSQPSFAMSKLSIVNAGATVQPTSVQSPRLCACCHSPRSTTI